MPGNITFESLVTNVIYNGFQIVCYTGGKVIVGNALLAESMFMNATT